MIDPQNSDRVFYGPNDHERITATAKWLFAIYFESSNPGISIPPAIYQAAWMDANQGVWRRMARSFRSAMYAMYIESLSE